MTPEKKRLGKGLDALLSSTRVAELKAVAQPKKELPPQTQQPETQSTKVTAAVLDEKTKTTPAATDKLTPEIKKAIIKAAVDKKNQIKSADTKLKTAHTQQTPIGGHDAKKISPPAPKTQSTQQNNKTDLKPNAPIAEKSTTKIQPEEQPKKIAELKKDAPVVIQKSEVKLITQKPTPTIAPASPKIESTQTSQPTQKPITPNVIIKPAQTPVSAAPAQTFVTPLQTIKPTTDTTPVPTATQQNVTVGQVIELPLNKIVKNPHQPRQHWDDSKIVELADSIRANGVIQPVVVRKMGTGFQLIAGERRFRAAAQAGKTTIPAIIKDATEEQMVEWSLIENIHREDLNPLERARAYQHYMNQFHLTQDEASQRLGDRRSTLANYVRLLDLAPTIQDMILDGRLTMGHARALLGVVGGREREELAKQSSQFQWSVRELENHVQRMRSAAAGQAQPPALKKNAALEAHIRELQQELSQSIMLRTVIQPLGRKGDRGRVLIEYNNLDDFEKIRARLTGSR